MGADLMLVWVVVALFLLVRMLRAVERWRQSRALALAQSLIREPKYRFTGVDEEARRRAATRRAESAELRRQAALTSVPALLEPEA